MNTTETATAFDTVRADVHDRLFATLDDRIARLEWSASRLAAHQRAALRVLLAHAIEHSPFHRARLAGIDPARFELDDLAALPVMTKAQMMDDLDRVFTDRRLTSARVEQSLAMTTTEPVPIDGEFVVMSSGGSSGRRGVFVLDKTAMADYLIALSRALVRRLREIGVPGRLPIAFVGAASAVHATGAAPAWTADERLPFRMTSVPVTQPLPRIVAELNALQPPALYGYPTMLVRLAAERAAGRLQVSPMLVGSTSETLTTTMREQIAEGFGVPAADTFGSTEGLVGTGAPGDDVLLFNSDMCITELVDEQHRPVAPGTPSAKVLVTNLTNRVQPLIRYELSDSFVQCDTGGYLRARVQGRCDDVLRYDGVEVHPLVVRSVLSMTPAVADYQVRQTERGVDVAVVTVAALDAEELRQRLAAALHAAGLADPTVAVRAQPTLTPHPQTGKLQRFVPLPR